MRYISYLFGSGRVGHEGDQSAKATDLGKGRGGVDLLHDLLELLHVGKINIPKKNVR